MSETKRERAARLTADRERRRREPVVTTTMFTAAEQAAWKVAVDRGLNIDAADLRALLMAGVMSEHRHECSRRHVATPDAHYETCACGARRPAGGEWQAAHVSHDVCPDCGRCRDCGGSHRTGCPRR